MQHDFRKIGWLLMLLTLLSGCSITNNLPEGERLYRGIKGIDYSPLPASSKGEGQEGVITALADAYNTVEGLLSGESTLQLPQQGDDKAVRDSMKRISQKDQEAYASAKEEVEAVLSYAPNGALMGSSFVTHPFPIKLLIYNKYAGSKHRFGRWMFNHFAASPVLISNVNPRLRSTVAKNTLRSRGYFRAQTSYEIVTDRRDSLKQRVRYDIHPGPVYHLDSISFMNFPDPPRLPLKERTSSLLPTDFEDRWNVAEGSLLHRGSSFLFFLLSLFLNLLKSPI